ncbi:MAG TPA: hypothetical protein VLJ86_26670 [Ramlibacter sp.]|nr:hypothetical protein [Ramlibacter sp.]
MDEIDDQTRVYFSVLDPTGHRLPAVEYWAGTLDSETPVFQVAPLRRFIKLLGSGEPLRDAGDGLFTGAVTGRSFIRIAGTK